jgi:hypothetical protein
MDDQFFLIEKLQRAISLHIDGVSKIAVNRRKHRADDAGLMPVARPIDPLANCKPRHRELLLGIIDPIIPTNWLIHL